MIDASVLEDYDRWLHRVANDIGDRGSHDDIVQEGRIAMWRALETYDESLGSLPSWLTRAARQRMRDFAWGKGQPTGHEAVRGEKPVEVAMSLDVLDLDTVEELGGIVEEAYHDGHLLELVRELSPAQQRYIFLRFWAGLDPTSRDAEIRALIARFPVLAQRHHWQRARAILRDRLTA